LQDPNRHYGIDPDKAIYFSCVAASEKQAKELQYADFSSAVNSCTAMTQNIRKVQELEFSVLTETDKRKMAAWKKQGRRVQRDISKLRGRALPANARTLRGYTSMALVFDEFAWFMQGESDQSDEEVYEASKPSLSQFGLDGMLFVNSSPYAKVGKFYERFEESQATDNGQPLSPSILGIQFPSWAMYEDWWRDPEYRGVRKHMQVSPDWDTERKHKDGSLFYVLEDRQNILLERETERQNPSKFKVERRSRWAEVIDSYLMPEMVDRMFAGRPLPSGNGYQPLKTNWDDSTYLYRYKAHLDPSSTTAGFGFALGHVEEIEVQGRAGQHVVFDIIKRWEPGEFPEGVINWETVLPWVLHVVDIFRPYEVTFDQFNSSAPIQWLRKELRRKGIGETNVYEKTATSTTNWNRAEIFKTALYQGIIHAPFDTDHSRWAAQELKYLQEVRTGRIPRVDKQDVGPVQTKDMADCCMEVVEAVAGNIVADEVRGLLGSEEPRFGAPGGYPLGGPDREGRGNSPLGPLYQRRQGEQATFGTAFSRKNERRVDPSRRASGGKPIPRRLPGW
jgi:hypothetical protein